MSVVASSPAVFSAFRFREVTSTMDAAKEIIKLILKPSAPTSVSGAELEGNSPPASSLALEHATHAVIKSSALSEIRERKSAFVVIADLQTKGRGTGGRSWAAPSGNLMMSLAIPTDSISMAALPVLPLLVGISARAAILAYVRREAGEPSRECADLNIDLKLKWPNDLLCQGKKLMGVLIEHEGDYMVIGVGINVGIAPVVDTSDGSRAATCVREALGESLDWVGRRARESGTTQATAGGGQWSDVAAAIGEIACKEIINRIAKAKSAPSPVDGRLGIVREFDAHMARDIVLRRRVEGGGRGAEVLPLGLNEWGHLRVKHVGSLKEEVLAADYLN